jgi:alkylation response protein AidB-like acyl-CoA dehydrogenase
MEFGWNEELTAFRDEVRAFAKVAATPELAKELAEADDGYVDGPITKSIKAELDARGWIKFSWPVEFGGQGRSAWFQFIMSEELQAAGVPYSLGSAAMIGPAISRFGTEEQKERYLPGMWAGTTRLCLGYSEPNAGTDLASLQTSAVRDGDDWVINGQKLWTSGAHHSTHVWLASRTDPKAPKHRGISMFIVPTDLPGINIRPVWTMTMRTNEVFLDDVRIPGSAMIGEEGRGWYVLANALDHERVSLGGAGIGATFRRLVAYLRQERPELIADQAVRRRLADLALDLQVQRALALTNASVVVDGRTPTMEASMAKVWASELRYRMTSMAMDTLGRSGVLEKGSPGAPLDGELPEQYRFSPVQRFGGGTNEVMRNIIAQRGLGLPR